MMGGPRGTINGNARGSSYERRRRRAWIMEAWASEHTPGVRALQQPYRGCLAQPCNHEVNERTNPCPDHPR